MKWFEDNGVGRTLPMTAKPDDWLRKSQEIVVSIGILVSFSMFIRVFFFLAFIENIVQTKWPVVAVLPTALSRVQ